MSSAHDYWRRVAAISGYGAIAPADVFEPSPWPEPVYGPYCHTSDALAMALELANLLERDYITFRWLPEQDWFNPEARWLRAQVIQALREGR